MLPQRFPTPRAKRLNRWNDWTFYLYPALSDMRIAYDVTGDLAASGRSEVGRTRAVPSVAQGDGQLFTSSHGRVMDGKFIAYYRVSTDHQGVNGNGTLSARRSRII